MLRTFENSVARVVFYIVHYVYIVKCTFVNAKLLITKVGYF